MAEDKIQLGRSNDTERQIARVQNEKSWSKVGGPLIVLLSVPLWAAGVAVLRQFSFSWITIPAFTVLWFGCYAKAAHDIQHETGHAIEDHTEILRTCVAAQDDIPAEAMETLAGMGVYYDPNRLAMYAGAPDENVNVDTKIPFTTSIALIREERPWLHTMITSRRQYK
jgi:hypothetical protein